MKIKRVLTALCCLFAALFLVTGIVDLTAKDKLYSALFKTVSYGYPIHGGHQTQLKKGDYVLCGTYDGEQLLWRVVSENGEVLQSEYIVDFAPFGKTSDWEKSDLKKELEKNIDGVVGDVSVLSKNELSKLPAGERKKQPTASAAINCKTRFLLLRKNCWYWTSTGISTNSLSVAAVTQSGAFYKSSATDELMGVCPALRLKSNSVSVVVGDGSKETPYVIGGETE